MLEPLTIISAASGVLGSTALHIVDLAQNPAEVEAGCASIIKCRKKLDELVELRNAHHALLAARYPRQMERIDETIGEMWKALRHAMPILERNRIDREDDSSRRFPEMTDDSSMLPPTRPRVKNPATNIGRRLKWKLKDRNLYKIHEPVIMRNYSDVQCHITWLEFLSQFQFHDADAALARAEQRRRREELSRARADQDAEGLDMLVWPWQAETETSPAESVPSDRPPQAGSQ